MIIKNFLLLALSFSLVFCSGTVKSIYANENILVNDMAGRQISIPVDLKRIVCLGGALRYIVYMKGLDKIVGIEALEKEDRYASASRLYGIATKKVASELPIIGEGGPGRLPDFEKLIKVAPDIIISMGLGAKQNSMIQDRTGIPVLTLKYGGNIGTIDINMTKKALGILGKIFKKTKRSEELNSFIDDSFNDLDQRTFKNSSKLRKVYVGGISYKGYHGITSTDSSFPPLKWINTPNTASGIRPKGHIFINMEQLLMWDPEIIFIDTSGLGMVAMDYQKKKMFYQSLSAVKKEKVFTLLPFNTYHSNLEIALANAYFMGKTLYPEKFGDVDPVEKSDEIFQMFIGQKAYKLLKKDCYGFGSIHFDENGIRVR